MKKKEDKKLETLSFEARYDPAYAIWDNAGAIALELNKKYKIDLEMAEPNKLKFIYKDTLEIRVELQSVVVTWYSQNSSEKEFIEICGTVISLVQGILGVSSYIRLGARKHFFEKKDDLEEAVDAFYERSYTNKKTGNFFGIQGSSKYEERVIRWEDDDIGVLVRAQTQKKEIKFNPPINMHRYFESSEKDETGIFIDIDYYTKKLVTASQLNIEVWLKQASDLIDEDAETLLSA